MIQFIRDKAIKATIAKAVLHDLKDWFGIDEATNTYIKESQNMPFFAVYHEGEAVGFAALKTTSPHAVEIYVIGIKQSYHRQGFGQALVEAMVAYAKQKGYRFLQVKTVAEGNYAIYDRTLAFYKALGFYELEVFKTLWDKTNPCQLLVMPL